MKKSLLLAITLTLLASCTLPPAAPGPEPESQGGMVQANEPRIVQVDVAPDISGQLVQGLNRFAFDLYHNLPDDSGSNRIFSPYSISLAFSMVYAGARGNTETEMAEVMHYLSQESQHPAFNALDQRLGRLGEVAKPAAATPEEAFRLSIANSVWGQQGFPFEEAYLATLARHYGAGLQTVDFANHPEQARQLINDWISDQTEERIRDMVPEGAVSEMTRLVLANAIYFKAVWLFPFNEKDTSDSPFTLLDGSQEAVPLMQNNTVRMPFFEGDGYHAAIIPYRGDKVDMLVILPAEGQFEKVEGRLSPEMLTEIRQGAVVHDVRLTMPKFEYDMELDLVNLLSGMGMADAFHGGADFSGIGAGLSISEALHKATITVDEEGTEAAAATMIAMEVSAMEGAELSLDHPFIYALIERESGVILFLGRVLNPAG